MAKTGAYPAAGTLDGTEELTIKTPAGSRRVTGTKLVTENPVLVGELETIDNDLGTLQSQLGIEVGLARNADNLTSGTVADARIASTIARDTEVTAAVAAEALLARNGNNITSGTVADARIDPLIARDSEVTAAVAAEATLARNATNLSSGTVAEARVDPLITRMYSAPGPSTNIKPQVLWKARKAIAKVRTNIADMNILFVGDSKTMGTGANTYLNTLPMQFQQMLNYIIPTTVGWIFPNQGTSTPADARYTMNSSGTGWTVMTQLNFSQGWFNAPSAATGVLTFTIPHTFDTVKVLFYKSSGHGTSTINIGGGAPSTGGTTIVGNNATAVLATSTFTMAAPQAAGTTVTFSGPTGGQIFIAGVICTLSTQKRILVTNAGRGGYATSNIITNTNPYDAQQCYAVVQPDLTIYQIGTNDATASLAASTFATRLTTAIGYGQATGDALLQPTAPSQPANNVTFEPQYAAQERLLSVSLGTGFTDIEARLTSWAVSNPQGWMFDTLHPNELGYADQADALYQAVRDI